MEIQFPIPVDVLYHIFCFLNPRDVVRLRLVSRQFRDISYAPEIWRTLYASARVPRPPGPFPSQRVQFLERTLIKSERLERSWTRQPMRCLSGVQIRLGQLPTFTSEVINGKWLIGCESSRGFVAHDLDSETALRSQQVLWEHNGSISNWDACCAVSSEGPVLYIMLSDATDENPFIPWKLLEFRVTSDSNHLYHSVSLDIPMKKFDRYMYLNNGHAPFLYIGTQDLIFDVGTRQFYEFPPAGQALDNLPSNTVFQLGRSVLLLTKTHIIVFQGVYYNDMVYPQSTLVQTFTLPADADFIGSGTTVLRLSHEGFIPGHHPIVHVIRNSIVDPVGGGTSIRLLKHSILEDKLRLSCIDLTLPKHAPADINTVLQMTIETHDILEADIPGFILDTLWRPYVEYSDDGYVRGFWQLRLRSLLRFTINASQERCTAVLGKLLPVEYLENGYPRSRDYSMDSVRGRLCYDERSFVGEWEGPSWSDLAIVVDIE